VPNPTNKRTGRVAVLSDVHGNAVALEAVLEELSEESVDLIVFGGDLTWGPLPQETLALVTRIATPTLYVRGNAERALLEPSDRPTERERWLLERHSTADRAFTAEFAPTVSVEIEGLGPVLFCHGSPRSDEELVTPGTPARRVREFTAGVSEPVIVSAHTHLQFDRTVEGVRLVNPGSVGMPYEGRPGAFWAVLGPDVSLRRTAYRLGGAVERYRASGDPLAEQMVELLLSPPTRSEVIEDAERREFAG
jgi:putative phosphoesterase